VPTPTNIAAPITIHALIARLPCRAGPARREGGCRESR
jgi:hypothetical protein